MLFDEMHHWASAIDDLLDNDPVYLRYVGMTTGEDVTSRHFQDLSQRKLGLLSSFYSYLSKHRPNVLSRTTTMETHWHSDVTKNDWDTASRCEQILIALLGPSSLLNRQSGEERYQFSFNEEVRKNIQSLRLDSYKCFQKSSPAYGSGEIELKAWCEESFQTTKKTMETRGYPSSYPEVPRRSHRRCNAPDDWQALPLPPAPKWCPTPSIL
jgi:hypothetical protein